MNGVNCQSGYSLTANTFCPPNQSSGGFQFSNVSLQHEHSRLFPRERFLQAHTWSVRIGEASGIFCCRSSLAIHTRSHSIEVSPVAGVSVAIITPMLGSLRPCRRKWGGGGLGDIGKHRGIARQCDVLTVHTADIGRSKQFQIHKPAKIIRLLEVKHSHNGFSCSRSCQEPVTQLHTLYTIPIAVQSTYLSSVPPNSWEGSSDEAMRMRLHAIHGPSLAFVRLS